MAATMTAGFAVATAAGAMENTDVTSYKHVDPLNVKYKAGSQWINCKDEPKSSWEIATPDMLSINDMSGYY